VWKVVEASASFRVISVDVRIGDNLAGHMPQIFLSARARDLCALLCTSRNPPPAAWRPALPVALLRDASSVTNTHLDADEAVAGVTSLRSRPSLACLHTAGS